MDDPEVSIVQVPGNMTNPDPVQHNLFGERAWPEEQRVCTDIVQPARDAWDNAFCYGGTFLLRRSAAEEIGGIPEDSITEDLYLSYALRARGYVNRYLHETLNEGLASENVAQFIVQRVRWGISTMSRAPPFPARPSFLFWPGPVLSRVLLVVLRDYCARYLRVDRNTSVQCCCGLSGPDAASAHDRDDDGAVLDDRPPGGSDCFRHRPRARHFPALLRGLLRPFGYPWEVTLKGEKRAHYVIQWKVLGGLADWAWSPRPA